MKKTLLSWSSGKDSAWALYQLKQDPNIDLVGLFTVINKTRNRVAMHAVRVELLKLQAESAGLPLQIIEIPEPCSNEEYAEIMSSFTQSMQGQGIEYCAFGDLFLEDIRDYRVNILKGTGVTPIFPIWGISTKELSETMVKSGLKAIVTSVDPKQISPEFSGRFYDQSFLNDLPVTADPCGENGEFHTMVIAGPMFKQELNVVVGEIVERQGFYYTDVVPLDQLRD